MNTESILHKETWQSFNASEYYQKFCVPKKFEPWPPVLLARLGVQRGERLLDCACGTGVVTRHAAQKVGRDGQVTGLDFNPKMLAVARSQPSEGAEIQWVEASVDNIPFPEPTFDVVTCQLGLMYFPDRVAALREMNRVLLPRGRAGILVWRDLDHAVSFKAMADVVEKYLGIDADPIRWPYNMGNAEALIQLMEDGGFCHVTAYSEVGPMLYDTVDEFFHEYLTGSPISTAFRGASEDAKTAAVDELREMLAPFVRDGQLKLSIGAYIAVGRK